MKPESLFQFATLVPNFVRKRAGRPFAGTTPKLISIYFSETRVEDGCGLHSTDVIVRGRCFVVWRRCFGNSRRIYVGIARARNQRHYHYRER